MAEPIKTAVAPTAAASVSPESKPATNFRWVICALLFWVTTANYVDRGVFGNLAPELQKEIGWTQGQYWYMTVAFNAAYAVSLLLAGRMMDVLGLRWGFTLACVFWGLASMSHALVSTVAGFFIVRILLGLGEGGNFPAAIKTTAEWFPKRERALATGIFNCGSNIGGVLVPFGLPFVVSTFTSVTIGGHVLGWRGAFLITAVFDITWIVGWLLIYKRPQDHPRVSKSELALINSDPPEPTVKIPWRRLFPHRQAWAFATGKLMTDCFWWFYLVGAPYFFADRFGLSLKSRSLPVAIIYIMASVGSIAGGWLSGHFMKIGWTVNKARKITFLICTVCVLPVVFATITHDKWVAVGLITLAASAHQAWSANIFSLAGDMFPRRIVGSVTGFGGFAGSVGAIALFMIVGKLRNAAIARGEPGNYFLIFLAASLAYLTALLIIHLLAPKLEPAKIEEGAV
ncbi:MAG TPA: MFS transporter [Candidatus Binatia bacterium]|jgi:ACS family hexuronate transporter-like MFS transporter|nr:MFS transporter [Candidatus Binatia bacterium]